MTEGQGQLALPQPAGRGIRCYGLSGQPYLLATDGIEAYWASENPRWLYVKMSRGAAPILVVSTVAQMEEAIRQARTSPSA